MFPLILNKYVISFIGISIFMFTIWFSIQQWHYEPIESLEKDIQAKTTEYDLLMVEHLNLGEEYQKALDDVNTSYTNGYKQGKKDAIKNTDFINPNPFSI